ncbi:MAG: FapA family protein [Proteobacteria bacterium]|nr:FapA family protein [Pseudomonadota bacterium]MBU1714451.1 FapA family protein [Pseudomonadota bacterium]
MVNDPPQIPPEVHQQNPGLKSTEADITPEPVETRIINPEAEEAINRLSTAIYATLQKSQDSIKCSLRLPDSNKVPPKLLATSLEKILHDNFGILIPRTTKSRIKLRASDQFSAPSQPGLPARTVQISFEEPARLKINGCLPKKGEDSYADLAFDWEKRSGTIDLTGSIDWKKINSIPNILSGELLATIHDRTEGFPGVDFLGRPIKQAPGRRHPLKFSPGQISRKDDPNNETICRLYANFSGAVNFRFRNPQDPKTLERINITETLSVKSDVNYDFGNLESAANLEIDGSLRGNFSIQSDGYIKVKGSAEGRMITARKVIARLITNGCVVNAREEIECDNINNATATAETINIKQTASGATLKARQKIYFNDKSSFLGIKFYARTVILQGTRFAGINEIFLGEELFQTAAKLLDKSGELAKITEDLETSAGDMARNIITLLLQVEELTKSEQAGSVIKELINSLKRDLLETIQFLDMISAAISDASYELETVLGERNYNESIQRKVDQMITQIKRYNALQVEFTQANSKLLQNQSERQEIKEAIVNHLALEMNNCQMINPSAELKIKCGSSYMIVDHNNFSSTRINIRYHLPEDSEIFDEGILEISP